MTLVLCQACERGDHANCGMQSWCECDDPSDGDPDALPDYPVELADLEPDELDDLEGIE